MTETSAFDLVVVGGGINGTGIAREAALRGLKVLLLEKTDIGAGTTSGSSRLIHGGLRYLEHGEIPLVYESLQERETLLHTAPHLVQPLALTLPIYERSARGPLMIRAGMIAYDVLSWKKSLPRHTMFDRSGALAHERGLNPVGLKGAARYYDAQIEFPERLSVESMLDAQDHGAVVKLHTEATGLILEAGVVRGVRYREVGADVEQVARTGVVVNVAGPWVDQVLADAGVANSSAPLLGVTRGTHIVVREFPGAPADALYVEAVSDGRPYFIIPWNGLYLIGTTDTRYEGNPDDVHPTEADIRYLLNETNAVIPSAHLSRDAVRFAYSGLRPLPYQREGSESGITRRHIIHSHEPQIRGLYSIVGGKLTTYRNLAEQVVDTLTHDLPGRIGPSISAVSALPGAVGFSTSYLSDFQANRPDWLSERSASALVQIYGARAQEVVDLALEAPELREPLSESSAMIGAAVVHAVREEGATTISDAILRRTMLGYGDDAGMGSVEAVAALMQAELGWTDEERDAGIAAHLATMERFVPNGLAANER